MTFTRHLRVLVAALLLLLPTLALAVEPHEVLSDPALEARARAISTELRCLVCQNQSIDGSDAELAADLRLLVRERLVAGDTDEQVLSYVTDRYGEFVLLKPRFAWHTLWLWLAAPVLLIAGLIGLLVLARRPRGNAPAQAPADLTDDERAALERLRTD